MELYETPEGRLGFRNIPIVLADLLRQVPHCGDRENEAIEARLFPAPSLDEDEEHLRQDWKAHVEPGLHEIFLSARQVVESDLRALKEEDDVCSVEFPVRHAESWLNALNQARLALAAQHDLGEDDMVRSGPIQILNERDLALLQIEFYADLQHWLIEILDA